MQQTPNYNLPQFDGTDYFNKEALNDAFSKIDTGISDLQETVNNASGNAVVITQEVISARKGKANLEEKISEIDANIDKNSTKLLELEDKLIFFVYPSTIEENNTKIQNILNKALNKHIVVYFSDGDFEVNKTLSIFSNTTLILSNKTRIIKRSGRLFVTGRVGGSNDSNITRYNGYSNIVIKGGTIQGHCLSMIHSKNVRIEGVTFKNCGLDHYFEIAGCKDVIITNCSFNGMQPQSVGREYVEYIQIDSCIYSAFPGWNEGSLCYDNTENTNIFIENNSFSNEGDSGFDFLGTAIGSHSENLNFHKNIVIRNNLIKGTSYSPIRMFTTENLIIKDNKIQNTKTGYIVRLQRCKNVDIKDNKIDNCVINTTRIIDVVGVDNYDISNNIANNLTTTSSTGKFQFVNIYNHAESGDNSKNGKINCNVVYNSVGYNYDYYNESGEQIQDNNYYQKYDLIYNGSVSNGAISLLQDVSKYSALYINVGAVGSGTFMTSVALPFNNQTFGEQHGKIRFLDTNANVCSIDFTGNKSATVSVPNNLRQIYGLRIFK